MRASFLTLRRLGALTGAAGLALGLAPPASAQAGDADKVTLSRAADPGEYPAQVALLNPIDPDNFNGQFCGGTHVTADWVLTAAHCVVADGTVSAPDVLLGTNVLDGTGLRIPTVETVVHPAYDGSVNDIALLRLAAPTNVAVQRLVLPGLEFLEAPGPGVVVGWGGLNREDVGSQAFPLTLQEGDVPLIDDATCQTALLAYGPGAGLNSPPTQVCAGIGTIASEPEEVDACRGDSGGPLLVPVPTGGFRQAGIVSFGPTCGFSPTAYTSVVAFIDFIEAVTAQQLATFPDIPGDVHEANIERVAHFAITAGDSAGGFSPGQVVNRGQMATFIGRALGLTPISGASAFFDIGGNTHEGYINALAATGIAGGFSDGSYQPNGPVSRGQMATFIGRALGLTPLPDATVFTDVDGDTHEGYINALAAAGIAGGFADGSFQSGQSVFRNQMATFIARGFLGAPLA